MRGEGFLDAGRVRQRWRDLLAGDRYAHNDLWGVLAFQAWLERSSAR
jgi:hypothetical protein